jgi:branched-chain amino acid transport system ATP-binding protein
MKQRSANSLHTTEGLAPVIRVEIWGCIEKLKADGQSIMLIDKNRNVIMRFADRHFILKKGSTV